MPEDNTSKEGKKSCSEALNKPGNTEKPLNDEKSEFIVEIEEKRFKNGIPNNSSPLSTGI